MKNTKYWKYEELLGMYKEKRKLKKKLLLNGRHVQVVIWHRWEYFAFKGKRPFKGYRMR